MITAGDFRKGVTFEMSNIEDLTHILQKLCNTPKEVSKYKKNAQKFILNKYNWDDVVEETLKLYGE